jgi:hypothetical protein
MSPEEWYKLNKSVVKFDSLEPVQNEASVSHWGMFLGHKSWDKEGYLHAVPTEIKPDAVNSPAHYNKNHKGIECIQAMEAMLTPEEFLGYLRGNMFKYSWRFRYKNGAEDVAKHKWYADKLAQHLSNYPELNNGN